MALPTLLCTRSAAATQKPELLLDTVERPTGKASCQTAATSAEWSAAIDVDSPSRNCQQSRRPSALLDRPRASMVTKTTSPTPPRWIAAVDADFPSALPDPPRASTAAKATSPPWIWIAAVDVDSPSALPDPPRASTAAKATSPPWIAAGDVDSPSASLDQPLASTATSSASQQWIAAIDVDSPQASLDRPREAASSEVSLLEALRANSVERVGAALQSDPGSAGRLLLDHDGVDPPLCTAVRLRCHERIVSLLLESGADARSTDARGRQPLHLLCEGARPCIPDGAPSGSDRDAESLRRTSLYEMRVAGMLLDRGASALSARAGGGGDSCSLRIAECMGKKHLVKLLRARCFRHTINVAAY